MGINVEGFIPHAWRATAATNALDYKTDVARVQELLGHANISTSRLLVAGLGDDVAAGTGARPLVSASAGD